MIIRVNYHWKKSLSRCILKAKDKVQLSPNHDNMFDRILIVSKDIKNAFSILAKADIDIR